MKYLEQPCTRCGMKQVIPPQKKDINKPFLLVRCEFCKKHSRYNILSHADGGKGYWLSKWGRGGGGDIVKVKRNLRRDQLKFSSEQIRFALDKFYPPTV